MNNKKIINELQHKVKELEKNNNTLNYLFKLNSINNLGMLFFTISDLDTLRYKKIDIWLGTHDIEYNVEIQYYNVLEDGDIELETAYGDKFLVSEITGIIEPPKKEEGNENES